MVSEVELEIAPTVGKMLSGVAARHPDEDAIVAGGRRLSYRELDEESDALAAGLLEVGLEPGERIAVWVPNVAEAYVTLFAVAKMGGIFMPINPKLQSRELEFVLRHSGASALLLAPTYGGIDYLGRLRQVAPAAGEAAADGLPDLRLVASLTDEPVGVGTYGALIERGRARPSDALGRQPEIGPRQPALLQFTSGTTSFPKGALLAHESTVRMGFLLAENFGITPDDRYFVCNPICHLGGTTFSLIAALSHGATFVTLPQFDPGRALEVLERERCTIQHGIDSHYVMEMTHPSFDPAKLQLRLLSVGGVPPLIEKVDAAFRPDVTLAMYGATETGGGPVCGHKDDPADARLSTVGRPLPGITVSIVDPETGEPVGRGVQGEIRLGGWSLMLGYFNQPEETARQLDEHGRARSGDIGFVDNDGYLHFLGRMKNALRVGGEMVSPEEVEAVLQSHPAVQRAVVLGVVDEKFGEVPATYVALKPGEELDVETLRSFCFSELASFKVPRHFRFVDLDVIPMTESGKVQRFVVREAMDADPTLPDVSQV